ncbi:hypothetical protein ATCC90586_008172 [Pythium insidiosum]|nr:hypothetical protein ATCC90586_008172 [Pythium insidiosum]
MAMRRSDVGRLDIAERASYLSSTGVAKPDGYADMKTPDAAAELEGGALRAGGAPKLLSRENFGLLVHYGAVGLISASLPATAFPFIQNYLNSDGKTLASADALISLPWSLKVFYGLISDCLPIMGYRRRPYMVLGWTLCIAMLIIMATMPVGDPYWKFPEDANLNPDEQPEEFAAAVARANTSAPGKGAKYVLMMMLATVGYLLANVSADGVVVELAQREPIEVRGTTQSMIYGFRSLVEVLGHLIVGFGFNGKDYGGTFDFSISFPTLMLIFAIMLSPVVPVLWFFVTETKRPPTKIREYFGELIAIIQMRAVYQVIFYSFFFNVFSAIYNVAASPFSRYIIKVTPLNQTLAHIAGSLLTFAGIWITGKYGLHWSWRKIIIIGTLVVNAADAITMFITVWDVFRSQWMWLGIPVAVKVPYGISFVISTFVVVELATDGHEGAMYGLLTMVANLASPFAATLTKIIGANWDFSNERIMTDSHGLRRDMTYASIIAFGSTVFSFVFLVFLPPQKEATQKLKREGGSSKWLGGLTALYITFALVWAVMTNLMTMYDATSCLVIAGGSGC